MTDIATIRRNVALSHREQAIRRLDDIAAQIADAELLSADDAYAAACDRNLALLQAATFQPAEEST